MTRPFVSRSSIRRWCTCGSPRFVVATASSPLAARSVSAASARGRPRRFRRQHVVVPFGVFDPAPLAADGQGDLFIGDLDNFRIVEHHPDGSVTDASPAGGEFEGETEGFAMAADPQGDLYVNDFPAGVAEVATDGSTSALDTHGLTLGGIASNTAGEIVGTSGLPAEVVELTTAGAETVLPFTGLNQPEAVAVDAAGDVFVVDGSKVDELSAGNVQSTLGFSGLGTQLNGLGVDAAGDVFVSDFQNNRVVELPAGGGAQETVPFTGVSAPQGLAVSPSGDVYVSTGSTILELPSRRQPDGDHRPGHGLARERCNRRGWRPVRRGLDRRRCRRVALRRSAQDPGAQRCHPTDLARRRRRG